MDMNQTRREFLNQTSTIGLVSLAITANLLTPRLLKGAGLEPPFNETNIDFALSEFAGAIPVLESDKIYLKVPKVAENGAIVPIKVSSSLANVKSMAVFAEKNPVPLIARIEFGESAEPVVNARIKMAETSHIIAILNADDKLYSARESVKVTIGGCGS